MACLLFTDVYLFVAVPVTIVVTSLLMSLVWLCHKVIKSRWTQEKKPPSSTSEPPDSPCVSVTSSEVNIQPDHADASNECSVDFICVLVVRDGLSDRLIIIITPDSNLMCYCVCTLGKHQRSADIGRVVHTAPL